VVGTAALAWPRFLWLAAGDPDRGRIETWALPRLSEYGLIKGERIGVDASTTDERRAAQHRETR
jgi:hypothetical protein